MKPARHEHVCTQADIDAYVACEPCTEEDGGACAACLITELRDASTWGPEVPFLIDSEDLITLPNVWGCIDLVTGNTACANALYTRDACVWGECNHGTAPPSPCDIVFDAGDCSTIALATACKPYDDDARSACTGILSADGGPLAVVAACFAGKGEIAAVFCGPP